MAQVPQPDNDAAIAQCEILSTAKTCIKALVHMRFNFMHPVIVFLAFDRCWQARAASHIGD
jgi:hypothetical protein